jgi:hypothetical protein
MLGNLNGVIENIHECVCGALWTYKHSMIHSYQLS